MRPLSKCKAHYDTPIAGSGGEGRASPPIVWARMIRLVPLLTHGSPTAHRVTMETFFFVGYFWPSRLSFSALSLTGHNINLLRDPSLL